MQPETGVGIVAAASCRHRSWKVARAPRPTAARTAGNVAAIGVPRTPAVCTLAQSARLHGLETPNIALWSSAGRGRRCFAAPASGVATARATPPAGPGGTIGASPPPG